MYLYDLRSIFLFFSGLTGYSREPNRLRDSRSFRNDVRISDMGDYQQRARTPKHAFESPAKIFRIESGEAFVKYDQLGVLQNSARDKEAAAFSVGELPAGFADHLQGAGGHALEQVA